MVKPLQLFEIYCIKANTSRSYYDIILYIDN